MTGKGLDAISLPGRLAVLLSLCLCLGGRGSADQGDTFRVERSWTSSLTPKGLEELNNAIEKYPMEIKVRKPNVVMTRCSARWPRVFGEEVSLREVKDATGGIIMLPNSHNVYVGVRLYDDAVECLETTVERAYIRYYTSARRSTWSGDAPITLRNASFVAHFTGGVANELDVAAANVALAVSPTAKGDRSVTMEDLVQLGGAFDALFTERSASECKTPEPGDLAVSVVSGGTQHAVLRWTAGGELKDTWVRMDAEAGVLSLGDKNQVLLDEIPEGGTRVHLYAISPDGKTWYHTECDVPPEE